MAVPQIAFLSPKGVLGPLLTPPVFEFLVVSETDATFLTWGRLCRAALTLAIGSTPFPCGGGATLGFHIPKGGQRAV